MSILDSAVSAPWAMLPERVEHLLDIAQGAGDLSPEAMERYRLQEAERGERLKVRDDVAVLDVTGPLFKRANMFVRFSGATSYEIAMRDFQVALDDPNVNGIILRVDSPGGEANGCDELAAAIYDARGQKPITAYVSGMACSGGYWIASAADKIVVSDAAILGSIGVVLGIEDRSAVDEKRGVKKYQFVSSVSPGKRPDPATDEGQARIQRMVDNLADVFVTAVAKHRGVNAKTVTDKFGAGGVEVGANAVALGMADEVGQFESVFASLSKRGNSRPPRSDRSFLMSTNPSNAAVETSETPAIDAEKIRRDAAAQAAASTQARIKTIMTSDEGKKLPTLAAHFAYDTDVSAEHALTAMKAAAADVGEPAQTGADTYDKRKEEAGALGLAAPAAGDTPKVDYSAGWKKAVGEANKRFEVSA